jgi:hypothetical protein
MNCGFRLGQCAGARVMTQNEIFLNCSLSTLEPLAYSTDRYDIKYKISPDGLANPCEKVGISGFISSQIYLSQDKYICPYMFQSGHFSTTPGEKRSHLDPLKKLVCKHQNIIVIFLGADSLRDQ